MGVKCLDICQNLNSTNWNDIIRMISSSDSVSSHFLNHKSRSPGSPAPSVNSHSEAISSSKNDKTIKIMKMRQRCSEDGYRSKIGRFLNPCKFRCSSNKQICRRLNELENKVNDFEKVYCDTLVNLVTELGVNKENSSSDDLPEIYMGPQEKKKFKIYNKADGVNRLETNEKFMNKKYTQNLSKKQHSKKTVLNSGRRSAKNRYTMSQIRKLSPSAFEEDFSADSNITVTADETGKYYFLTSTAGYVKRVDKIDKSSIPYEAAAGVSKFSKKNLFYLFNQELLPRCIRSSHKNSNGYKNNRANKKKLMKKYGSDKSTSTERTLVDKSVNTKERYFHFNEDNLPIFNTIDIVLNTKPDTFETNPPPCDTIDITNFEISDGTTDSQDICFSTCPLSSSCTSFSETSDKYLKISMGVKK